MQLQAIVNMVYPPQCLDCGARVVTPYALCGACLAATPFATGLACDRCATPLPGESDRPEHCDGCLASPPPWQQTRTALWYADQARHQVMALKHGGRTDLARPMGAWMARAAQDLQLRGAILVPVPLHWRRQLRRRFNQSALLAHAMAASLGVRVDERALARPRATPSLGHSTAEEREEIMTGAIRAGRRMDGEHIILVDDVMTTGATLRACADAATNAGARRVDVVVLARAGKGA